MDQLQWTLGSSYVLVLFQQSKKLSAEIIGQHTNSTAEAWSLELCEKMCLWTTCHCLDLNPWPCQHKVSTSPLRQGDLLKLIKKVAFPVTHLFVRRQSRSEVTMFTTSSSRLDSSNGVDLKDFYKMRKRMPYYTLTWRTWIRHQKWKTF